MKLKLAFVVVLPLSVLLLGLLLLSGDPPDVVADDVSIAQGDWPTAHKNLSDSDVNSTYADIEAIELGNDKVVVIVWAEGESETLIPGKIQMKWKFESDEYWRRIPSQDLPRMDDVNKYSYPALALEVQGNYTVTAHVVWLHNDAGKMSVEYKACALTASGGRCDADSFRRLSANDTRTRSSPDIAVDDGGHLHVVWAEDGYVYYNNTYNGVGVDDWHSTGLAITTGAAKKKPVIAVSAGGAEGHVYVAWDDDTDLSEYAGIYVGRRTPGALVDPGEYMEWDTKWLSSPQNSVYDEPGKRPGIDSWPAIAVGGGRAYVLWQRLVDKSTGGDPHCYEHSLSYRVFQGGNFDEDWWPGGTAIQWSSVSTHTTYVPAGEADDLYLGVRPSIQVVSDELHVAWQYQTHDPCGGGGGEGLSLPEVTASGVRPSGEEVLDGFPFSVLYDYADHTDLPPGEWGSQVITIQQVSNGFFTNPDLAIIPGDHHPHVALQNRFKSGYGYAWDVWYANDEVFSKEDVAPDEPGPVYLPAIFKNY